MTRIFVTGGTGFIGSHFLNAAFDAQHEIVALRRSAASRPRTDLMAQPQWVDGNMSTIQPSTFRGVDVLVHLAAHSANVPYDTLEQCLHFNVMEPLAMMRTAIAAGVKRLVIAGSCFEYGPAGERYEFIPTDAPLEATLTYPASKAAASIAFAALAAETGVQMSLHRIFQVFGPGESASRLWPSLKAAAEAGNDFECSQGEQVRDFVRVETVARQLLLATQNNDCEAGKMKIEHIGSGNPQTAGQFMEYWWDRFEASGKLLFGAKDYRDGEVMRFVPEVARKT